MLSGLWVGGSVVSDFNKTLLDSAENNHRLDPAYLIRHYSRFDLRKFPIPCNFYDAELTGRYLLYK